MLGRNSYEVELLHPVILLTSPTRGALLRLHALQNSNRVCPCSLHQMGRASFQDSDVDESALRYVVGPIVPALFRRRGGWDDFTPAPAFARSIVSSLLR